MRAETKKKLVVHVVAVMAATAAGLGIGFSLRKSAGGPEGRERTIIANDVAQAAREESTESTVQERLVRASQLGRQLEKDLSMSDPVTHWLYWLDAIEKAKLGDMPSLVALSGGDQTLLRMVGERWMEMDARNLFDWLITQERNAAGVNTGSLGYWFRREWARRDPKGLIKALREAPEFGDLRSWRTSMAAGLVEVDPEMGLSFMHEWHIDDFGPSMDGVVKWAAEDPQHAAEFALAHPAGFATQLALETIGKEWAKRDGGAALAFATSGPDEMGLKGKLAEAAMKSWAESDLQKAGEWLAGAEDSARDKLSAPLLEAWAKNDPAHALMWCEENLEGTGLKEGARGVLKGAAEKDVSMAARLVLAMEPSSARAEGAVSVAEKWLPDSFSGKKVPTETIDWLRELDAVSRRQVLRELHWKWAAADAESLAEVLLKLEDPAIAGEVYGSVVNHLARSSPVETIEWSGKLPEETREEAMSTAFNAWRRYQPQPAMEWLDQLAANDPRKEPLFERAVQEMARFEREAAEQLRSLPPHWRKAAREILETMPLENKKRANLLAALE